MNNNKVPAILAGLSFAGLLDASYLAWQHYANGTVACSLTKGCEQVLTSQYAEVYGIPLSLAGAVYYAVLFFSAIAFIDIKKIIFLKLIALLSGIGLMFSGYLVYLQLGVINSVCVYCMLSATITLLLFSTAVIRLRKNIA
jgi:uncharacterized membrane protein